MAIAALVVSALSFVGVLVLGAFLLFGSGGGLDGPGGDTLTGQLSPAPTGTLTGSALVEAVSQRVTEDGGDVKDMSCPDTARVAQGVVTVCHGTISDETWAVVVFFEDAKGHFTLSPV